MSGSTRTSNTALLRPDLVENGSIPVKWQVTSRVSSSASIIGRKQEKEAEVFRLLDLPSEIRNIIYTYALSYPSTNISTSNNKDKDIKSCLALLFTCRAIYSETRLLPLHTLQISLSRWYSSNLFELHKLLRTKLAPWQRREIRRVALALTEADLQTQDPAGNMGQGLRVGSNLLDEVVSELREGVRELEVEVNVVLDVRYNWKDACKRLLRGLEEFERLVRLRVVVGKGIEIRREDGRTLERRIRNVVPHCRVVEVESQSIEKSEKRDRNVRQLEDKGRARGTGYETVVMIEA